MIPVTLDQIDRLAPAALPLYRRAFAVAEPLLSRYAINETALRVAHFVAQCAHETGGFRITTESLNYSVAGLLATFGKRITRERAQEIGRTATHRADQPAIANHVYGGEWGRKNLGNTDAGDGWRYRGRGPLQLTGRTNYRRVGEIVGIGLEAEPDLVLDPRYVLAIPAAYWFHRGCSALADKDDLVAVTKAINGGTIGLADRQVWLSRAKEIWS